MDEEEKLSAVLGILDNYWTRFTSDLSPEQFNYLKDELFGLENKIRTAKSINDVNTASRDFFEMISKLKPLEFLANIDKSQMRGGTLPELQDDVKIKIINYCVMLQDKINELNNENLSI